MSSIFETDCFSFGPTTGGGRQYNQKGSGIYTAHKRGDQARKRRDLKRQYRRSPMNKKYSFKQWLGLQMELKPAKSRRLRTHQTA